MSPVELETDSLQALEQRIQQAVQLVARLRQEKDAAVQEAVEKALKYAYVGRKNKKREFRSLWIVRINAGCRQAGISYSKFMHGLKAAGVTLDRKVLAEVAAGDAAGFGLLVEKAKAALEQASS